MGWKFNRAGRTVEQLATYGELRSILAADPTLPALAEPEGAARPLAKLLSAPIRGSEVEDTAARHEAIREVWRIATTRTDGDIRAAVTEALRPVVLKQIGYRPIRRLVEGKTAPERTEDRRAKAVKAGKQFLVSGYDLLNLGAIDTFDTAIEELQEARRQWTP